MTPLHALEWVGVAAVALLVLALVTEGFRPRPMVRVDVTDRNGEVVATTTYLLGEEPASVRFAPVAPEMAVTVSAVRR